VILSFWIYFRI